MRQIPEINRLDLAFGKVAHLPKWDEIPEDFRRERGEARQFTDAVSTWFFSGAQSHSQGGILINGVGFVPKPGIDGTKALAAIKAVLGSFEPSHEHKTAGCAYLLSEWFDIEPKKARVS